MLHTRRGHHAGSSTHCCFLGDLERAARQKYQGKPRVDLVYVMTGHHLRVLTLWTWWRRLGADGRPIEGDSDALAIDVENPATRYTRTSLVADPEPILLAGEDSMHPIMRGPSMVPCDWGSALEVGHRT